MPFCPRCGKLVQEDALYCPNCGAPLTQQPQPTQPTQPTVPPYFPSGPPPYPPERDTTRRLVTWGYISSTLSLLIMPEIFGTAAIVLGVNIRRRGLGSKVLILGFICMFVGLFFTALFSLLDLLP